MTLVFQVIFVGTCAWSAAATSFDSYLAARIVNGFFCSVGQGGALIWIKDLFYYHEHPRAINYVEFAIILSSYLGPLITAFIVSGTTWRWAFWLCTILAGISLTLVFCFGRDAFRPQHPRFEESPKRLPHAASARHRTGKIHKAKESPAIMHAPHRRRNKDTCPRNDHLLLPQFRLGHWCQHNSQRLVDAILRFRPSRHWYLHIPQHFRLRNLTLYKDISTSSASSAP